jgi:hypothetical protein
VRWAREELNLRPLPCQQTTGNRNGFGSGRGRPSRAPSTGHSKLPTGTYFPSLLEPAAGGAGLGTVVMQAYVEAVVPVAEQVACCLLGGAARRTACEGSEGALGARGWRMGETRQRFHEELTALEREVQRTGAEAQRLLAKALQALVDSDLRAGEEVVMGDDEVDRLYLDVERRILHLFALQTPGRPTCGSSRPCCTSTCTWSGSPARR